MTKQATMMGVAATTTVIDQTIIAAIDRLYPRLYGYARLRAGREEAEDAVADALERVWRARRGFDPERGDADGWVYVVAVNAIRDVMRAARRRPISVSLDDVELRTEDAASDQSSVADLLRGVQGLSTEDADLIAMRFGLGLSNSDIGVLTSRSSGAVATATSRALGKLRAAYENGAER